MQTAYLVVTLATLVANTGIAIADFGRAEFVLANSAEVGVPRSWVPWLATAKLAGALGLLAGLLGMRLVGFTAAVGLVLFFAGALIAHLRARVYYNIVFPGTYFALAVASAALAADQWW
ncbi:DoxX family protein [Nocardia sp. X0981]